MYIDYGWGHIFAAICIQEQASKQAKTGIDLKEEEEEEEKEEEEEEEKEAHFHFSTLFFIPVILSPWICVCKNIIIK